MVIVLSNIKDMLAISYPKSFNEIPNFFFFRKKKIQRRYINQRRIKLKDVKYPNIYFLLSLKTAKTDLRVKKYITGEIFNRPGF